MLAYKLFSIRKDGSLGPLFIKKTLRLPLGVPLVAHSYPTKGFAVRPGWHCCAKPLAPHLSKKKRVWCEVDIDEVQEVHRPDSQGGLWYLAQKLTILRIMQHDQGRTQADG